MKKEYPLYKIIFVYLVSFTVFVLAKLIYLTCKKEFVKTKDVEEYEASNKPLIYVFWHGRLFPMSFVKPKHRILYAIVSRHLDGEILTKIFALAGIRAMRGSADRAKTENKTSKDRGGVKVLRESIKVIEAGHSVGITPDGPKGPRFYFKRNFIKIASRTNTPMVLVAASASNCFMFKSWDRFILPKPFSTIKLKYSALQFIPEIQTADEIENCGKELENILNSMTQELDAEFNIRL